VLRRVLTDTSPRASIEDALGLFLVDWGKVESAAQDAGYHIVNEEETVHFLLVIRPCIGL
jgi:hypothetical protein